MTLEAPSRPKAEVAPSPVLENGDHLGAGEFMRRFEAMPRLKKAELIEGKVYVGSPVRTREHGMPHARLSTLLGIYAAAAPELIFSLASTALIDEDNIVQPDVTLALPRSSGGGASLNEDGYLEGAPELACEVAASTVSYDLHEKLALYQRVGVREYLVWRVQDEVIDWFVNRDGAFEPLKPDNDGITSSTVFPGLRLQLDAIRFGRLPEAMAVLNAAIATDAFRQFVDGLRPSDSTQ